MRTIAVLMLCGAALAGPLTAQGGADRWQITLDSGEYIWDIRLVRLAADSLAFRQADTMGMVDVARIAELRLIRKTTVHAGGADSQAETMTALMGGSDEVYDFRTLEFPERLRAIQQLLLLHPPAP